MRPPGTSRPMPSSGAIAAEARARVPNGRRPPSAGARARHRSPGASSALPQPLRERRRAGVLDEEAAPAGRLGVGRRATDAVMTGPVAGRGSGRRRSRKSSRSPLPEKPRPRRGLSPGSAARLRSSRPVEPNVPAASTTRSARDLAVGLRRRGRAGARDGRRARPGAGGSARASRRRRGRSARASQQRAHVRAGVDRRAQVGEVDACAWPRTGSRRRTRRTAGRSRAARRGGWRRRRRRAAPGRSPKATASGGRSALRPREPRGVEQRARLGRAVGPRVALGALHRVHGVVVARRARRAPAAGRRRRRSRGPCAA